MEQGAAAALTLLSPPHTGPAGSPDTGQAAGSAMLPKSGSKGSASRGHILTSHQVGDEYKGSLLGLGSL